MNRICVVFLGLLATELSAHAEGGIFKCTGHDGAIVYQGQPCAGTEAQVVIAQPRKPEPAPAPSAEGTQAGGGAAALPSNVLAGSELQIGMSDTKVLNMRGWGRPRDIVRSRGERGWHEEWTYESRTDGSLRTVQFVNGKVAALGARETPLVVAAPRIRPQDAPVIAAAPDAGQPQIARAAPALEMRGGVAVPAGEASPAELSATRSTSAGAGSEPPALAWTQPAEHSSAPYFVPQPAPRGVERHEIEAGTQAAGAPASGPEAMIEWSDRSARGPARAPRYETPAPPPDSWPPAAAVGTEELATAIATQ